MSDPSKPNYEPPRDLPSTTPPTVPPTPPPPVLEVPEPQVSTPPPLPPTAPDATQPVNSPTGDRWNWGAGVVVALAVVATFHTLQLWVSYRYSRHVLGDLGIPFDIADTPGTSDPLLQAAVLGAIGTGLAGFAAVALVGRHATPTRMMALLAGLVVTTSMSWGPVRDWSEFVDLPWELQIATLAPGAVPLLLGALSLGLRRPAMAVGR